MNKAVVVFSGGMDSATVLADAVKNHGPENIHVITFDYGSKHSYREVKASLAVTKHYQVRNHKLIYLPFINELFKSDLLKNGGEIPEGHYEDPSMKRTVVPFRNGIMLSISAGYAESMGAEKVYIGNHAGDHAIYPDCRTQFIVPMRQAIEEGTYSKVQLIAPFCHLTKSDVVLIGKDLKVPYEKTYSCYKGGSAHCGKCGTCVERKEAFQIAGIFDPTIYEFYE